MLHFARIPQHQADSESTLLFSYLFFPGRKYNLSCHALRVPFPELASRYSVHQ